MIIFVTNLYSMLVVVLKRLWHNLGLTITAILGVIAVLGIVVCVPVFSHAVSSEVLSTQLNAKVLSTHRRLFSEHMYFLDTGKTSVLNISNGEIVANYIVTRFPQLTGLLVERVVMEIQSGALPLMAPVESKFKDPEVPIKTVRFLTLDILPQYAEIVQGEFPAPDTGSSGPIKVAVPEILADEIFLNIGEHYTIENMDIEIAGIWRPINPEDPIWFENPEVAYADKLWVAKETYQTRLEPIIPKPVFFASWYVIVSEAGVRFQRAMQYARGLIRLDRELKLILPGITTDYSPLDALGAYQKRAETLTSLFYAVGGPMIVLALLFIGLTARIAVQQYEQEIATMRGRGTSWLEIVGLNLAESLLLILFASPFSLLLGWLAAGVMGRTVSFLNFSNKLDLTFSLEGVSFLWLGIAAVLITFARFLPTLDLSRTTIVRVKQEQSRASKKPAWEKFFLDFLLLGVCLYAYLVLRGWAKPGKILARLQVSGEAFRDPLLFVAPALFAIAVCMIMLRVVPLLMRLLATLVERLPGIWAYLSLQQIARRPQDHSSALLLIMISLSLSIFSASTAKTLDRWLYDSIYYSTGADIAVHEYVVQGRGQTTYGPAGAGSTASITTVSDMDINNEGYVSVEDHLKLPSVTAATRVGKYNGTYSFGIGESSCLIMGIDRIDFPKVGYYREDFASQSLGALMNALGADPSGVLIPLSLSKELGLTVGDHLTLSTNVIDQKYVRDMIIVGTYNYFPSVYPDQLPTLIVNLESIFDSPEAAIGYDIWLRLRKNTEIPILLEQLKKLLGSEKALVQVRGNAIDAIKAGQNQPERLGLFGILNVGFLATGLMPGIGFVLYSYASLRNRFIQLGILQAIGLSVKQLVGYLVTEQFLLMSIAILSGALIGLLTSTMYVPFLQVGSAPGAQVPPFEVLIGWSESGWLSLGFGFVLFLTILGTIAYLIQLKVFQAVKLGEAM